MQPEEMMMTNLMPVLFVPHGGGPMPLLGEPNHRELTAFLQSISAHLPKPKSILVISAHWEEEVPTLTSNSAPGMLFDYYGFPPESYEFKYPALGFPALAQTIEALLAAKGIKSQLNPSRDFDHGTFVPLMLMYPQADIPVVQISLLNSLNPTAHIALGKALAPLREQGVLILGSGLSFHNMQAFFSGNPLVASRSRLFDDWLVQTLVGETFTSEEQENRLMHWKAAPEARFCHPREEHLLPLHVCFGAAAGESSSATQVFSGELLGAQVSGFLWR
jgi:aromatic ring-opening dioxygenase catalytic subunit (LigB family)